MKMIATLRSGLGMLIAPNRTVKESTFDQGAFSAWILCQIPLLLVLTWTGLIDPAQGYGFDFRSGALYLGGAGIVSLFSMLLALAKSFLVMWAGGIRLSLLNATRKLLPLHCLLAVLEALANLILFLSRGSTGSAVYTIAEQLHLFGQELLFGIGAAFILYQREQVSLRRSIAVGMGYFLCASGWLLLTMLFG